MKKSGWALIVFGAILILAGLGDSKVPTIVIGALIIVGGVFLLKKKTAEKVIEPARNSTTKTDAKLAFKIIEKKEKLFKDVTYLGGFPNIEAKTGVFNKLTMHLCALPAGISFYDVTSYELRAVIPWGQIVKIETSSGMSDFGQAVVTGAATKSKGFGQGLATGMVAGMLEKNALVFHIKQNADDDFIHEIKFDDSRNEEIKTHLMSKRVSLFPNGIKQNTSMKQASQGDDTLSQISKLAALKDQGILTEAEFTEKKKTLLEKIQ